MKEMERIVLLRILRKQKEEADRLIGANSSILDEDYEYVGIGVIQHGENFSYVVIVD